MNTYSHTKYIPIRNASITLHRFISKDRSDSLNVFPIIFPNSGEVLDSNVITNNEIEYSSVKKDRFQMVTTNISLNLNNKHENQITSIDKQETFNIIKTIEKEYSVKNDNNPATKRSISDTFVSDVKLLK